VTETQHIVVRWSVLFNAEVRHSAQGWNGVPAAGGNFGDSPLWFEFSKRFDGAKRRALSLYFRYILRAVYGISHFVP
jgi:hypothetical protein